MKGTGRATIILLDLLEDRGTIGASTILLEILESNRVAGVGAVEPTVDTIPLGLLEVKGASRAGLVAGLVAGLLSSKAVIHFIS